MTQTTNTKPYYFKKKATGRNTLIIVGVVLVALGIFGSFFSSQVIEKFFWEARTKSEIRTVGALYKDLGETDISRWQENDARERIIAFSQKIKQYLPSIAAMKIYTTDGTLAWTDLKNIQPGYREPGIETEIKEVADTEQLIKPTSFLTKQELMKEDLLEIWTVMRGPQGNAAGFIELYFDSSDITAFINKIQYSIWGTLTIVLGIIITLIGIAFRKQYDLIIRQARELSNIIEHSPVGIYTIDTKGVITSINAKMLELIEENDAQKIIGQNVIGINRIQRMNVESAIKEALLGVPFDKETNCRDDKGGELYRHYRGTPLFADDNKTVEQVLFMVEDITERKKLEKGLTTHAQDLEKRVDERTKELQTRVTDLEQFERVTVGRELRMTELKQEMEKMRAKLESLGVKADTV